MLLIPRGEGASFRRIHRGKGRTVCAVVLLRYASESARGGVLEPAGIAEIKFRKAEVMKTMLRVDKQLQWMSMNEASGVVRPEDIDARKNMLFPYYQARCAALVQPATPNPFFFALFR